MIISAWFLIDKPFHFRRIAHTWLTVIGYTIPILLFLYRIGEVEDNFLELGAFPIESSPLWYAGYYCVLIFISPFLNLIFLESKKNILEYTLIVLFLLLVLYPTITGEKGIFFHDLFTMVFVWLLTGYIRKWREVPRSNKSLILFLVSWSVLTSLRIATKVLPELFTAEAENYFEFYRAGLQTFPNLLMSFSAFFAFYGLKIHPRKWINTLASATLGVYCFHQVPIWYNWLWINVFRSQTYAVTLRGVNRMLYVLISIMTVWIMGTVIELLRTNVSRMLIEDRKWYLRICNRIDRFVNESDNQEDGQDGHWIHRVIICCTIFCVLTTFISRNGLARILQFDELSTNIPIPIEELKLSLEPQLVLLEDGSLNGNIFLRNEGKNILQLSSGGFPINLGISTVDQWDNVIELDYLHLPILNGRLQGNTTISIPIHLENVQELLAEGAGIRFSLVQESVNWILNTAVYFR